jgi:hypothetical protein
VCGAAACPADAVEAAEAPEAADPEDRALALAAVFTEAPVAATVG